MDPVGFGEHRSEGQRESTTPQQHSGLQDGCTIGMGIGVYMYVYMYHRYVYRFIGMCIGVYR